MLILLTFLTFWDRVRLYHGGGGGNRTPVREWSTQGVYRFRTSINLARYTPPSRLAFGQSTLSVTIAAADASVREPDECRFY